jgi:hypothetical protein
MIPPRFSAPLYQSASNLANAFGIAPNFIPDDKIRNAERSARRNLEDDSSRSSPPDSVSNLFSGAA